MHLKELTYEFRDHVKLSYVPLSLQCLLSFILACYTYPIFLESLRDSAIHVYAIPALVITYLLLLALWISVQKIVLFFDRRMPWPLHFVSRLTTQALSIVVLPSVMLTGVLSLALFFYTGDVSATRRFAIILHPMLFSFLIVINLVYTVWFLVDFCLFTSSRYGLVAQACDSAEQKLSDFERSGVLNPYLKALDVRVGFRKEIILVESIGLFEASAQGRSCMLKEGGFTYEFDYALDTLAESLDPNLFFKVSRRYLVNRDIILGYEAARHGRILVQLKRSVKHVKEIVVSRDFAKEFKSWYEPVR
ncbi:LytTr DNA-binding domain-containing protein [Sphingobacterium paludis]|uniref:LytTr DNA-binding domain-containing protein n=1 Tax=Sphingobacterium paludis TaxID=1476465 RepID=A0A4R7CX97_9SPHI|nr:LytTr DNA-binding domain-containing protein [Sphingobacterium paludis]